MTAYKDILPIDANGNVIGLLDNVATTGAAGYTLINGTGAALTYTVPSDGALHCLIVVGAVVVTSTMTGGQIQMVTTTGGTAKTTTISAGSFSNGTVTTTSSSTIPVDAGSTVTINQSTALTAGAAKLYLSIFSD